MGCVLVGSCGRRRARQHHQPRGLDAHRAFALEALELLVHALARRAEQLRQVFLRQLQSDADFFTLGDAVALGQQDDLLGQAGVQRPRVQVLELVEHQAQAPAVQTQQRVVELHMLRQQFLEVGLAHGQQGGLAVGVGIVRARQSIEQGDVAEPYARLGVGQGDLLARQRDRADAYRTQRHTAPLLGCGAAR
jgi:hypothetical protein